MIKAQDAVGEFHSPGGFVFGVQGWTWGDQRPTAITFFLDGTAKVFDQHGRPIKGAVHEGVAVYFDRCTHLEVIEALGREKIDWQRLACAGWPQLPLAELRKLKEVPPTPLDELRKIRDSDLRKAALTVRRETDAQREKEAQLAIHDDE